MVKYERGIVYMCIRGTCYRIFALMYVLFTCARSYKRRYRIIKYCATVRTRKTPRCVSRFVTQLRYQWSINSHNAESRSALLVGDAPMNFAFGQVQGNATVESHRAKGVTRYAARSEPAGKANGGNYKYAAGDNICAHSLRMFEEIRRWKNVYSHLRGVTQNISL